MLAGYLLQTIEQHSDTLTEQLIKDLTSNERTPSYRRLPVEALRERALDIYQHLVDWLAARSETQIEAAFELLGRQRFGEQVPLEELVYAIILTKHHLRDRVRSVGSIESSIQLHDQIALHTMIGLFFDRALYATVKGYEQARGEPPSEERPEPWAKFRMAAGSARVGDWVP